MDAEVDVLIAGAGAAGMTAALVVQGLYGGQVTDYAKVAFGLFDMTRPFSFVGIDWRHVLWLVSCVMGISLLAVLPSLVRNVRRSPIDDMRDE